MNQALNIFIEAFFARLLPIFSEVTLGAVREFHAEDYLGNALVAGVGALAASVVLYRFGVWLRRFPERVSTEAQQARVARMQAAAGGWFPWVLILAPMPIGCAIIMAAGFFRVRPLTVALALVAAEVLWRVSPLVHR